MSARRSTMALRTIRLRSSITNTRMRGCDCFSRASTGPSSSEASRNGTATVTEPSGPSGARCSRSRMAAASDSRRRASWYSCSPAAVGVTPTCERSNSCVPSSASSFLICAVSAGCATYSDAAARDRLPASSTAMK
ncbi:hypothetical protein D9M72_608410 [compost metagenome]